MKDQEIIQAFLSNDDHRIGLVYKVWRDPFWKSVSKRTNLDELYRDDAYQDAFIRLQQHILSGRLSADNLQVSVLAYFKELGYYTALENIRSRKELPESQFLSDDEEPGEEDDGADGELPDGFSIFGHDGAPVDLNDDAYDPMHRFIEEERNRIVRDEVMKMGNPCAPLLLGFYWEGKSMEDLALELGYANADSAKAQKAKCMKKLKTHAKQLMKEYGYDK